MPLLNPSQSWLPLEARFRAETDPRTHRLIKEVRYHVEHEIAGDLEREDTPDGVRVLARLPAAVAARYQGFTLSSPYA